VKAAKMPGLKARRYSKSAQEGFFGIRATQPTGSRRYEKSAEHRQECLCHEKPQVSPPQNIGGAT
jgi:hypothetical protein